MIDNAVHPADSLGLEALLRDELARGDAEAGSVPAILRQLAGIQDSALFGEEVLTRTRAMLADLAGEVLDALVGAGEGGAHSDGEIEVLTRAFLQSPVLLGHVHALALEWQLTDGLQARAALDPVVSPLVKELIAHHDAQARGAALAFLAAQSRWSQSQRRMGLALRELPVPVFEAVLAAVRALVAGEPMLAERAQVVEAETRRAYDPHATRLALAGQLVRLVTRERALCVADAGIAVFLSALAQAADRPREAATLVAHEGQGARLALVLRAAGLDPVAVEEQILALHPASRLPAGFERLGVAAAAAILAASSAAVAS